MDSGRVRGWFELDPSAPFMLGVFSKSAMGEPSVSSASFALPAMLARNGLDAGGGIDILARFISLLMRPASTDLPFLLIFEDEDEDEDDSNERDAVRDFSRGGICSFPIDVGLITELLASACRSLAERSLPLGSE